MDRTSLKDQAKAELNPNFSYYLRISLPALLLTAFVALVPFPLNENMHRAGIRVVGSWQPTDDDKWLLEQHRNVADSSDIYRFADSAAHDRCQLRYD